ncbi:MAG: hypothetical protein CL466_05165 [Acidimicrobiaceae bacterium]|nr:hypothetical protein [Acidimicrobiaceae bacterium]
MAPAPDGTTAPVGREPTPGRTERDGVGAAWLDWGGDGPPLLLLHPNGFCAGVYDPIARRLVDRYRVVGVDLRGHGASDDVVDEMLLGNDALGLDVLAVADAVGLDRFAVAGVSWGGAVGIEVAAVAPERVSALVLCEAVVIDATTREEQHFGFADGEHPLAVGALRRRDVWADRATVEASYGSRPPLQDLAPEALAGYVRWGFRDRPDGTVELSCRPQTEATIFGSRDRHGPVGSFEALRRVVADGQVPIAVLAGSRTDLDAGWFAAQADLVGVDLQVVDGGHFCLFEDSDRGARLVDDNVRALAPPDGAPSEGTSP